MPESGSNPKAPRLAEILLGFSDAGVLGTKPVRSRAGSQDQSSSIQVQEEIPNVVLVHLVDGLERSPQRECSVDPGAAEDGMFDQASTTEIRSNISAVVEERSTNNFVPGPHTECLLDHRATGNSLPVERESSEPTVSSPKRSRRGLVAFGSGLLVLVGLAAVGVTRKRAD
jgi:hypothetical protein